MCVNKGSKYYLFYVNDTAFIGQCLNYIVNVKLFNSKLRVNRKWVRLLRSIKMTFQLSEFRSEWAWSTEQSSDTTHFQCPPARPPHPSCVKGTLSTLTMKQNLLHQTQPKRRNKRKTKEFNSRELNHNKCKTKRSSNSARVYGILVPRTHKNLSDL